MNVRGVMVSIALPLAGVLGACSVVSNPAPPPMIIGDALRRSFYQSESITVYVAATDTFITVYNDQQGVGILDPNDPMRIINFDPGYVFVGNKLVWHGHTFAGYSVGCATSVPNCLFRYRTHDLIQPIAPAQCPLTAPNGCALLLRGNPWVATNGNRVLYANLAYADYWDIRKVAAPMDPLGEVGPDAVAVARDETGTGAGFGGPIVALRLNRGNSPFVDQPSISMLGDVGLIAVHDIRNNGVYLATSDNTGDDTAWSAPQFLNTLQSLPGNVKYVRTIVKLRNPTLAYMAYLEWEGAQIVNQIYNVVVVRLARASQTSTIWTAQEIFRFDNVGVSNRAPGAMGHPWNDQLPVSFDIGDGGRELHVVFRVGSTSLSDVAYYRCRDEPVPTCNAVNNAGWTPRETFGPVFTYASIGSRFQPWIAADPTPGRSLAAIGWYERTSPTTVIAAGVLAGSSEPMPHTPYATLGPFGACVAGFKTSMADPTGVGRYGDYESMVWTPYTVTYRSNNVSGSGQTPLWMMTYARSLQCISTFTSGSITNDQLVILQAFF